MSLGSRLKALRKSYGISRALLAEELLVSSSSLAKYESDLRTPDIHTLRKLAAFFEVSCDYILEMTAYQKDSYSENKVLAMAEGSVAAYKPSEEEYKWLFGMHCLLTEQRQFICKQIEIFIDLNAKMSRDLSMRRNPI